MELYDVTFTVPGKPVPKQSTRKGKHGFYRDPRITKHQQLIRRHANLSGFTPSLFMTDLPVEMFIHFKIKASEAMKKNKNFEYGTPCTTKAHGDEDNLKKCVKDALNGVFYEDDSQVYIAHTIKTFEQESETVIRIRNNQNNFTALGRGYWIKNE